MKKLSILFLSLLLLGSCSQQDNAPDIPVNEPSAASEPYSGVARDIWVNVLANRFGGYHKGKPNTRAEGAFTITPYVEQGDTLMYIVQYEQGWELYSASKATGMRIFSSNEGRFMITDSDRPEAMQALIDSSIEMIKYAKEHELDYVDPSWNFTDPDEEELRTNVKVNTNGRGDTRAIRYPEVPPGEWVLIGSEEISTETHTSPKLIQTRWHQGYPWNMYSKKVLAPDNTWVSALAGCAPIAIAQYLYYTHFKDGVPKYGQLFNQGHKIMSRVDVR